MKRSFFFHYNKPASAKAGEPRLSVHWAGACHIVGAVECHVPIASRNRRTQPRCVMSGKCTEIWIQKGLAIIR
jgi:hypothetical protein